MIGFVGRGLLGALLISACGAAPPGDVPVEAPAVFPVGADNVVADFGSAPCRPIDEPWSPGRPLRLPCEPTFEPCDGADNDGDGITDPHCPTVECTDDRICTLNGLVPDADCNDWEPVRPGCNQIDGLPDSLACQGMLCPPGRKCVGGECLAPGAFMPGAPCTHGGQCAMNAGCIPRDPWSPETAVCQQYCHAYACPVGWTCVRPPPELQSSDHPVCRALWDCDAARQACAQGLFSCAASSDCALIVSCRVQTAAGRIDVAALGMSCDDFDDGSGRPLELANALLACNATACAVRSEPVAR